MLNKKTLLCLVGATALSASIALPVAAQSTGSSSGGSSTNPPTSSSSGSTSTGNSGTGNSSTSNSSTSNSGTSNSGTSNAGSSSQDTSRSGAVTGTTPSTASTSGNMSGQVHGSGGQQKAKSGAAKSAAGNTTASTDNSSTSSTSSTAGAQADNSTTTSATSGTAGTMAANSTTGTKSGVTSRDRSYMRELAHQNLAEIEMAKMAQTKTKNDSVRSFADRMLTDHTKALDDLRQLAQKKGVDLPTTADVAHKAQMVMFKAMPEATFDKNYLSKGGISDHEKTHRLLVDIGNRAQDSDLKSLSASMLQVVQQHQQLAQQMSTQQPVVR